MDKYENLGLVGEGSYGMVLRCRHKESGQLVAIKKFLESDDDKTVRKIALREIKLLKQLRHDNLVNLIDAFRRKKRVYLVFEFVHHTVLDELEQNPRGLDVEKVRQILWQLCRAIDFCHQHNVIHRDVKPENILISKTGIVKLCDFGFARTCAQQGEPYTDYVATRWYRAPELLVGDTKYGKHIDVWAIGCLVPELATGEPLFPGDSDIDQIYHIVRAFGNLSLRLQDIFRRNKLYAGTKLPSVKVTEPLETRYPQFPPPTLDFLKGCLRLNADDRYTTAQLLKHEYFHHDGFAHKFSQELKIKIDRDIANNPLLREQKRHLMVTSAESGASESTTGKHADEQPPSSDRGVAITHPNLVPISEIASTNVSSQASTQSNNQQISLSPAIVNIANPTLPHHPALPNVMQPPPQSQQLHHCHQHVQSNSTNSSNQVATPPPHAGHGHSKYADKTIGSKAGNIKHGLAGKPMKTMGSTNSTNANSPAAIYGISPPGVVSGNTIMPITGYGYSQGGAGVGHANAGGYRSLGRTKEQQPGSVMGILDALPQLPDVVGTGTSISSRELGPAGGSRGAPGARRLGQGQLQNANSSNDALSNSHHHTGGKETLPNI